MIQSALMILIGVSLLAAVNHLLIGLRRPLDGTHLLFGLICILTPVYAGFRLINHLAETIPEFVFTHTVRISVVLIFFMVFPWFTALYTGVKPQRLLLAFNFFFAVMLVANIFRPYGIYFSQVHSLIQLVTPWGERLVSVDADPSGWRPLYWGGEMAVFAFVFSACFLQYRRGQRQRAATLGVGMSLLLAGAVNDSLVNFGVYDFVQLGAFCFFALVIVMSLLLSAELRRNERQMLEERAFSDAVIDSLPGVFFLADKQGLIKRWNNNFERLTGYTPGEILKMSFSVLGPPKYKALSDTDLQTIFEGRQIIREVPFTTKEGQEILHSFIGTRVMLDQKPYSIAIGFDITEQKQVEQDRLLLSTAVNQAAEGVIITDEACNIQYVNPAFEKMTGHSKENVIGHNPKFLKSGQQDDAFYKSLWETISGGEVWSGELTNRRKDGTIYQVEMNVSPVRDHNGQIVNYIALKKDITEQKRTQEKLKVQQKQLIHADKMSSLGVLVSGVVHEINNPNTSIMLNVPLVSKVWDDAVQMFEKMNGSDGEFMLGSLPFKTARVEMVSMLEDILEGSRRIKTIVENLKNFARMQDDREFTSVDINSVVESAVRLLRGQIARMTRNFTVNYSPNIKTIRGNFHEIEQVVINLITNSCQSLHNPENFVRVNTSFDPKENSAKIEVCDQGEGISEENLKKIMDPFFTTKRDKGGTGLGLSVSYGIVRDHGGRLEFTSTAGEGTIATLLLPVSNTA